MESIEYQVEFQRSDGPAEHTSMTLPPALTKSQRLDVPVEGGFVQAEVIEVTNDRGTDQVEAVQGTGKAAARRFDPNR